MHELSELLVREKENLVDVVEQSCCFQEASQVAIRFLELVLYADAE